MLDPLRLLVLTLGGLEKLLIDCINRNVVEAHCYVVQYRRIDREQCTNRYFTLDMLNRWQ